MKPVIRQDDTLRDGGQVLVAHDWYGGWPIIFQGDRVRVAGAQQSTRLAMNTVLCVVMLVISALAEGGTLVGINHTDLSINRFSVDGQSGLDAIGPYQGGGGGCCYAVSARWNSNIKARIDWETGAAGSKGFPGFADEAKYEAWAEKFRASKRHHSKTVPVPDYTQQKVCGITVHFLPCDDVQVTTSCLAFGSPDYPIKTPLKAPQPTSCPQPPVAAQEVRP